MGQGIKQSLPQQRKQGINCRLELENSMANIKNAVNLILSDSRGIYIPRDFLTDDYNEIAIDHCKAWGLSDDNHSMWIDAANPDSEFYWEAWHWILDNAKYTCDNGDVFTLYQDGDLWALCFERMTAEEKYNLGFEGE